MSQRPPQEPSSPSIVRYVVNHKVEPELVRKFEAYMRDHLAHVAETGCFLRGTLECLSDTDYRLVWLLQDQETFGTYQRVHAPALRQDFADHFPSGVVSTRDLSQILACWPPQE